MEPIYRINDRGDYVIPSVIAGTSRRQKSQVATGAASSRTDRVTTCRTRNVRFMPLLPVRAG